VDELARQFNVSRTVVREALKVLGAKGLLEARHGDGTYVLEPGIGQLGDALYNLIRFRARDNRTLALDLMELRGVLDSTATRYAALRATADDLVAISGALERPSKARLAGDDEAVLAANVAFHVAVGRASHNSLLALFVEVIAPLLRDSQRPLIGRDPKTNHHRRIFDAVVRRDPEAAASLSLEHTEELRAELHRSLFEGGGVPAPAASEHAGEER
jgi:GntR family transcriptional repressor for pyruvate dehydrogenase complex